MIINYLTAALVIVDWCVGAADGSDVQSVIWWESGIRELLLLLTTSAMMATVMVNCVAGVIGGIRCGSVHGRRA